MLFLSSSIKSPKWEEEEKEEGVAPALATWNKNTKKGRGTPIPT